MQLLFVCTLVPDVVDDVEDGEEPEEGTVFPPPATSPPWLPPAEDEEEEILPPASTAPPYVQPVTTTSTLIRPPATPRLVTPPPATPPPATPPPDITITPLDAEESEENEEEQLINDRGKKRDTTEETVQKDIRVKIFQKTTQSSGCVWFPPLPLVCLTAFFILHV